MALTTTINNGYELQQLFKDCGREGSFSILGYDTLFEYLDDMSESMGEDINVDAIAIDCDYTEYDNYEEIADNYSHSFGKEVNEDNIEEFKQWLNDNTTVIEVTYLDNLYSVIMQNF